MMTKKTVITKERFWRDTNGMVFEYCTKSNFYKEVGYRSIKDYKDMQKRNPIVTLSK